VRKLPDDIALKCRSVYGGSEKTLAHRLKLRDRAFTKKVPVQFFETQCIFINVVTEQ